MTTNYWACTCGASGSYPWKDAPKTDEASADYKHNSPKHANCTAGPSTRTAPPAASTAPPTSRS